MRALVTGTGGMQLGLSRMEVDKEVTSLRETMVNTRMRISLPIKYVMGAPNINVTN